MGTTINRVPQRRRPRVLVLGVGFAGYHCLRELERRLPADAAELVAVNPADYMLYVPLLPEVSAGVLDPRRVAVPLRNTLQRTRLLLGEARDIDTRDRTCTMVDADGQPHQLGWDRLVVTCGAVTRLLSVPGVAEHAKGFKSIAESIYLRDHVLRQLELAAMTDDPAERAARMTFVAVGAGYTGTEVVAQGELLTREALQHHPELRHDEVRWVLVDVAPRVLPNLDERLSGPALKVLRERGVDVRLETTVTEVTATHVRLSDGSDIPARTTVWCVGVRPDPLVDALGLPTRKGRVEVDRRLAVPGRADIFAAGDAAAVPDPAKPDEPTPMTAQHAQRQGRLAGRNVAASLGHGVSGRYRYRERGFVVDLGGGQAVANPFHVPISGRLAWVVARGYHLLALPSGRARVAADWLLGGVGRRPLVQFGLVPERGVTLSETDRLPQVEAR
ncbi:NADH dehydrogenase [Longimycelium tulufanense]|uniref:NADH dehydrogenase n=1 Tax=Longimycelium tulufanense TaxID=907463 RepID=A0A8J3C7I9_9PSEU|nr:FAD-dependent oxidoreductase [Longimycelium tulufanense]GGM49944.1 NADH dehydrogenase [Longimycelium tulufanense]